LNTGFYVFVYDYAGPCVAHGARSDFVGKTLQGILDFVGNTFVDGTTLHSDFKAAADDSSSPWVQPG